MKFEEWYKTHAKPKGKSKGDVAKELGCSNSVVSDLISGKKVWVSRKLAEALARVTEGHVTALDVLPDPEPEKPPEQPQESAA